MEENKTLYLFFRDREKGITDNLIDRWGEEDARKHQLETAQLQLSREGYPIPKDIRTVVMLHSDWAGDLESEGTTSVQTLLDSIRWFFKDQGKDVEVTPFAHLGGTGAIKQFWIGYQALLPVYVTEKTDRALSDGTVGSKRSFEPETDTKPDKKTAPAFGSNALENKKEEGTERRWRNVYIFISSTFNDMHAERNYLVKRVFPELSQWCAAHRLRLRDIDLRWGITEEDSMENRKTVEICLENIDRCRPFFLCFIGQRRGWVPTDRDIADQTFETFPKLKENLGSSVTEMEVIHSLIDPMRRQELSDADSLERAFFYLRDPDYLSEIRSDAVKEIYTNIKSDDPARDDRLLKEFREKTIPDTDRPCRDYSCRWDPTSKTPELGAIKGAPEDIVNGALTDFVCEGKPLCDRIIEDLKSAIAQRYHISEPDRKETDIEKELEEQSLFLYTAGEAFIEREGDLEPFESYIRSDSQKPMLLTAKAGMGKSSLLAHWILSTDYQVYYRFVGRSVHSNTAVGLAYSIWQQLYDERKIETEPPESPAALLEGFEDMLAQAAKERRLVLVLDAIDQLPGGVGDVSFLPRLLPPNVKLIFSVKEDSKGAERYITEARSYAEIVFVKPLSELSDRIALVDAYLSNYLKKLSDDQQNALISSSGADNPLYLKVVLSELRVFGAYDSLQSHIEKDFGSTPVDAFSAMLNRLENDAPISSVPMKALVTNIFGWLSHTRYGLESEELAELMIQNRIAENKESALDSVYVLERQLRVFLTERELRIDFFYDSFREACLKRYTEDKPSSAWHKELAHFFEKRAVTDAHSLLERAYQYVEADETQRYLDYVLDYRYLEAQLAFAGVQGLIGDYRLLETPETETMIAFLGLAGSVLTGDPAQLIVRLTGHLSGVKLKRIGALLKQAQSGHRGKWLNPLTPCFEQPRSGSEKAIAVRGQVEQSVALLRNDTLAAAIVDKRLITIWNIETGAVEITIPAPQDEQFSQLAATNDGKKLVVSTLTKSWYHSSVMVFETDGFRCVLRFPVEGMNVHYEFYGIGHIRPFRFAVCGDSLLLKEKENTIKVYSLSDGSETAHLVYRWNTNNVALSESGIAAIGNIHPQNNQSGFDELGFHRIANPLYLFRLNREEGTLTPYKNPVGEWRFHIDAVCVAPDGSFVAGCDGTRAFVYRIDTGELVKELPSSEIRVMMFLKKENIFVAAGRTLQLFDAFDFHLIREIRGLGYCNAAAVSADESFLLMQVDDQKLRVISLVYGSTEEKLFSAPSPIRSVSLSKDGRYVYASCYNNWIQSGKERTVGIDDKPKLYLFDRHSGECLRTFRLCGRMNRDFTFLTPDGSSAVSKDFQDPEGFVFKRWEFPDDPLDEGEELFSENYYEPKKRRALSEFADHIQFSADRQFVALREAAGYPVIIYRMKTGRYIGKVNLKPLSSGFKKLFGKKKDSYESSHMDDAFYDITDDGAYLYVFFDDYEKPRLEKYDIARDRQLWSRPYKGQPLSEVVHTSYENNLFCISADGSSFAFSNSESAALISGNTGQLMFYINREEEECKADDYFAVCSDDGRYLAISGKRHYKDPNWRLRLYDTESTEPLAEFVADGEIGEIRFEEDQKTLLFGMGNGRIVRLRLTES